MPPSTTAGEDWTVNGRDYHNVKVGQVEPDRVHITYDGGLGTVLLKDLPPDLQKRFNYDPAQAKATARQRDTDQQAAAQSYASVDQERAKLQAQQTAQAEQAQAQQAQAAQQQAHGKQINVIGIVLQKIPGGGLLVSCLQEGAPPETEFRCMLKGMPNEADILDNDPIREVAFQSGSYSYTSTDGVTRTIAACTAIRNMPPLQDPYASIHSRKR